MGKGAKAQTIGYKYYIGMHLGLCHGPADKITQLNCDGRTAWSGEAAGGSVSIDAPDLFGGEKREGGVGGIVDIEMGLPNQGQNSYLRRMLGNLIPGYRGIVGLVFRQCYLGNNPYLKEWSVRAQRILLRSGGAPQWYPERAAISSNATTNIDLAALFPVLSQGQPGYPMPGTYYPYQITLGPYATIAEVVSGNPDGTGFCRPDDYFMFNEVRYGGEAETVPAGRVLYTLPAGEQVRIRVLNTLNNFSGVGGSCHVRFPGRLDMNVAHIIRECLTDPEWGMGYTDADIDDAAARKVADIVFGESMGVSLLWDKSTPIEDFVELVQRHCDIALYVSRKTGKYVMKAIRQDYNPNLLLNLDESNISSVSDFARITFSELTNSVTVTYWDANTGKDAGVTVTDTALVQMQGMPIGAPIQYPGFTTPRNATIAAQRDLKALSAPLLSVTIVADSDAQELEIGDVFKWSWKKWGVSNVIMRITGIAYGTGRNNRVKINCTQDVFDTDTTSATIVVGEPEWSNPSAPPSIIPEQMATEAPYFELVQALSQSTIDSKLLASPEIGYVIAAGSRPASAINASMFVDDGSGYEDVGTLDFSPMGKLVTNIDKTATTFFLENGTDFDEVVAGTHFQVNDELMRVDSLDVNTGAITVGRGVLDTVPHTHAAGDVALFWDRYVGFDPTEYVAAEEVNVKLVPVSGAGVFPIEGADALTVELNSRAFRPYAPGDLRINGDSYLPNKQLQGEVTITWTHRDRIQQTGGNLFDHTAGNIGPEAGTTYRVQGYVDGVLVHTEEDIAGTSAVWTPEAVGSARVEVHAKRDGVYSWQAPSHEFVNASFRLTEEGDIRYTEGQDVMGSEN